MGTSESAAEPHLGPIYVESGRVGPSFLPLAFATLVLACLLAWALAWSRTHWRWPIMAVSIAALILVQAVNVSIERGQCRRTSAGLTLGVVAGLILYVGSWIIGYELDVLAAGAEAVEAVRNSSGFGGVFGWYVFVARRERLGSPLSSLVHAAELAIAVYIQVDAALDLGRRVFDERLESWAQRFALTFRSADADAVRRAARAGNFSELARLPRLQPREGANPGIQVLVDHFGGPTAGPTHLSLRVGRSSRTPFRRLRAAEAAEFWRTFGPELGHGGPGAGELTAAPGQPRTEPVPREAARREASTTAETSWRMTLDPSAEVGRSTRRVRFTLAGLFCFGVLAAAVAAFAEGYKVEGRFPEPWGPVHSVAVFCCLVSLALGVLVLLLSAPLIRWREARRFSGRPGSWLRKAPHAERVHLNVCETSRYNARGARPDDHGFWLLDVERKRVLFEGLRERWVIDGRDVDRVEVLQDDLVDAFTISFVERGRQVEVVLFDASLREMLGFRGTSPVEGWVHRFRACLGLDAPNRDRTQGATWRTFAPGAAILVGALLLGSIPFRQWSAPNLGDLTAAEARLREPVGFFGRVRGRVVAGSVEVGRRHSTTFYVAFDLASQTAGLLVSGSEHQLRALGVLDASTNDGLVTITGFIDDGVPSEVGPLLEDVTGLRVPSDARVIRVGLEPHSPRSLGATIAIVLGGVVVAGYVTYRRLRAS